MSTISSGVSGSGNWGGMPPRMEGRGGGGKPSFGSIDTDGSGGLSKDELSTMIAKGPGHAHGTQDASGSTAASATSSASATDSTAMDDLFAKLDTDGDGSIAESELDSGMKPPQTGAQTGQNGFGGMGMDTQGFAAMMPPPPPPGASGSPGDQDADSDVQQQLFGVIDSDQDGQLSKSELSSFEAQIKSLFEQMQQMAGASANDSTSLTATSGLSVSA